MRNLCITLDTTIQSIKYADQMNSEPIKYADQFNFDSVLQSIYAFKMVMKNVDLL